MQLDVSKIQNKFPSARKDVIEALSRSEDVLVGDYEINNYLRLAHFLGQLTVESGGFKAIIENLNYSADRLRKVFPKYFRTRNANEYHRQPEKIANVVYGGRMGNTEPGDGWKFRGRGLIQLTGKNNYTEFKDFMDFNSLEETIEYLETPEGAIESAAWFWYQRDCSIPADKDDGVTVTKKINGGTNHLKERLEYTAWFKKIVPPGNYTIETTEDGSST